MLDRRCVRKFDLFKQLTRDPIDPRSFDILPRDLPVVNVCLIICLIIIPARMGSLTSKYRAKIQDLLMARRTLRAQATRDFLVAEAFIGNVAGIIYYYVTGISRE